MLFGVLLPYLLYVCVHIESSASTSIYIQFPFISHFTTKLNPIFPYCTYRGISSCDPFFIYIHVDHYWLIFSFFIRVGLVVIIIIIVLCNMFEKFLELFFNFGVVIATHTHFTERYMQLIIIILVNVKLWRSLKCR